MAFINQKVFFSISFRDTTCRSIAAAARYHSDSITSFDTIYLFDVSASTKKEK